ncbi:NUDIX hydrolase [Micromonospora sp. CPCC 206060]|uniref:NUDIX hydrolase n=1 Tax=Micromonospora sp. CPCC 206060 TaxID=3122406 RepID=UPI002FF22C3C
MTHCQCGKCSSRRFSPAYAGWLLLGGKVKFGESAQDAACPETVEEAGFEVGELTPTGVDEIRARTAPTTS